MEEILLKELKQIDNVCSKNFFIALDDDYIINKINKEKIKKTIYLKLFLKSNEKNNIRKKNI